MFSAPMAHGVERRLAFRTRERPQIDSVKGWRVLSELGRHRSLAVIRGSAVLGEKVGEELSLGWLVNDGSIRKPDIRPVSSYSPSVSLSAPR